MGRESFCQSVTVTVTVTKIAAATRARPPRTRRVCVTGADVSGSWLVCHRRGSPVPITNSQSIQESTFLAHAARGSTLHGHAHDGTTRMGFSHVWETAPATRACAPYYAHSTLSSSTVELVWYINNKVTSESRVSSDSVSESETVSAEPEREIPQSYMHL